MWYWVQFHALSTGQQHCPFGHVCSSQKQCKILDVVDIHTRQRVVIEFLTADGSSSIQIHRCLSRACGDDATDVSSDSESIILKK
jgi:hypothetical protein